MLKEHSNKDPHNLTQYKIMVSSNSIPSHLITTTFKNNQFKLFDALTMKLLQTITTPNIIYDFMWATDELIMIFTKDWKTYLFNVDSISKCYPW